MVEPVITDMDAQTKPQPKRMLSESQLAKLKLAREKALKVKAEMKKSSDEEKIKHYESKINRLRAKNADAVAVEEPPPSIEPNAPQVHHKRHQKRSRRML